MHEDDTPALDPMIIGADGPPAEPVEAVAEETAGHRGGRRGWRPWPGTADR